MNIIECKEKLCSQGEAEDTSGFTPNVKSELVTFFKLFLTSGAESTVQI